MAQASSNELMRVLHAMMLDITPRDLFWVAGRLATPRMSLALKAQAVKDSGVDRYCSRGPERLAFLTGCVGENREQPKRPDIEWITGPCHLHGRSNSTQPVADWAVRYGSGRP
jgi:hypothetical protein